jgi:hypothetical protein
MRGRMVEGGWNLRMVGVKQDRMDILYCTLYTISAKKRM